MSEINKFTDICGNFMRGACVLLNLVGHHLYTKRWANPELTTEVLPPDIPITYRHNAETIARDDALPIVTYAVGPTILENHNPTIGVGGALNTTARVMTEIKFRVSTTNIGLTSALAMEIGTLCMGAAKPLRDYALFLTKVVVGDVQSTQDGYYISEVAMSCGLGYPVWKFEGLEDKLREIGISLSGMYSESL